MVDNRQSEEEKAREVSRLLNELDEKQRQWPSHVKPMTVIKKGLLGFDDEGNLYWDGKPVEVRKRLDLRWWQIVLAVMTALGAFASGAVAVIRLWLSM